MSPEQTVLKAVQKAQDILAHYVVPGRRDPDKAINDLLTALDNRDVVLAVWELDPKSKPDGS